MGVELAEKIYGDLEGIAFDRRPPKLGILQVGNLSVSNKYIGIKKKKIEMLNWSVEHIKLSENASETSFCDEIIRMSEDEEIDGIIIQLPVPSMYRSNFLDLIKPCKDVDGLTTINQGKMFRGFDEKTYLAPCTAKGCLYFLEANKIQLKGAQVAVLGRSSLVGGPIGILLQQKGATVVHVNQEDENQQALTKHCDILISAIGVPWYVSKEFVKHDAFVVDIGLTDVNGRTLGDVHPEVSEKAYVSPSKGGIGPLTVAFLMKNLGESYKMGLKLR